MRILEALYKGVSTQFGPRAMEKSMFPNDFGRLNEPFRMRLRRTFQECGGSKRLIDRFVQYSQIFVWEPCSEQKMRNFAPTT